MDDFLLPISKSMLKRQNKDDSCYKSKAVEEDEHSYRLRRRDLEDCDNLKHFEPTPSDKVAQNNVRHAGKDKGTGDHLHDLIAKKYNVPMCQRCKEVMEEMNQLGPSGCRQEKDRIIQGIWDRREKLSGWKAMATKLPGAEFAAKLELGRLFDQAVAQSEIKCSS